MTYLALDMAKNILSAAAKLSTAWNRHASRAATTTYRAACRPISPRRAALSGASTLCCDASEDRRAETSISLPASLFIAAVTRLVGIKALCYRRSTLA